jgi:ribosomal protein S27E
MKSVVRVLCPKCANNLQVFQECTAEEPRVESVTLDAWKSGTGRSFYTCDVYQLTQYIVKCYKCGFLEQVAK